MPGGGSTSRFHDRRAGGAQLDQALEWTAEVYRAAGEVMAERGGRKASPMRAGSGRLST
jgi:hypothetical protein